MDGNLNSGKIKRNQTREDFNVLVYDIFLFGTTDVIFYVIIYSEF